jgi:RimJ/RimL family protein N-acetyltransferase
LDYIVRWRNKKEVLDNFFSFLPLSLAKQEIWYANYITDSSNQTFVIKIKESGAKIGTVSMSDIHYKNQHGEIGIMIGEAKEQGKGYALEATEAIVNYAFKELNLARVYLNVLENNAAAIRLYNKLGFQQEGVLRHHHFTNGSFLNVLIMGLLRAEWMNGSKRSDRVN